MRILHVNKFLYRRGGAEAYALDVADLQRQHGHDVALWGMQHPDNLRLPLEHTFPPYVEFEPPPAGAGDRVRLLGTMIWSRRAERGMAAALREFRPDVVHLHNVYHQLSPSILRPIRAAGAAAVMTLHDYKLACPTYSFLDGSGRPCTACVDGGLHNAARRRCGGSAAAGAAAAVEVGLHRLTGAYDPVGRFLCPSEFLASMLRRADIYPERLHVLSNFVDADSLPTRTGAGRGAVFVGRLSYEKAVDVLVDAAALLPPDVPVDIVGSGPEDEALRRRADAVAPGRVTFHGRVPR
jgi:glycosyltransferase involved in cell wall biosynthesis